MKDLFEMENTVVNLRTKKEYNEYMDMCDKVGWKWCGGDQPNYNLSYYRIYKILTCIRIRDGITFADLDHYKSEKFKIITLDELKEILKD